MPTVLRVQRNDYVYLCRKRFGAWKESMSPVPVPSLAACTSGESNGGAENNPDTKAAVLNGALTATGAATSMKQQDTTA